MQTVNILLVLCAIRRSRDRVVCPHGANISRQPSSSSSSLSQKPSKPSVGRQAGRQTGRQAGRQALTTAGRKAERLVAGIPHTQKPLMELAGSFLPALLLCSLFDARDFAKITYLVSTGRQKIKKNRRSFFFFYFNVGFLNSLHLIF